MKKNNVVLIGMPGCGKSTIGVLLAKNLAYSFMDSDLLIQEQEGRKLQEILDTDGIEYFEALENRVNAGIEAERTVIATGGSAVYGKEAMEHLRTIGTVVYLKIPYDELNRRIDNFETRGIVLKDGQTFNDLYLERSPLYDRYAHITVEPNGEAWETVETLTEALKAYLK